MREILEAPAVEWAAERRTDSQLDAIKRAARALNNAVGENPIDFDKVRLLDMDFHLTIGQERPEPISESNARNFARDNVQVDGQHT